MFLPVEGRWEKIQDFLNNGTQHVNTQWKGPPTLRKLHLTPMQFYFPEVGLYNYKKGVVLYNRKTLRQNKKALCRLSTKISNILDFYGQYTQPFSQGFKLSQAWEWKPQIVDSTFECGKFLSFDEAYRSVRRLQTFARAVSRTFFIGQGISSTEPLLWFRKTPVGRAVSKTQLIIDNPAFFQETFDYFLPQGVDVAIA